MTQQSTQTEKIRGSSETLRNESCFDWHWLAGLIDADGGFYISRNRYVSCEITMHEKEVQTLFFIKKHLGGSVSQRRGKRAYRWRLHQREPLRRLLKGLNGCFHTTRVAIQFQQVCEIYTIIPLKKSPLTLDTGWFSGFFSGDGSFSINTTNTFQPAIAISQAEKQILDEIASVVGGQVYADKSWNGWVWWSDVRSVLGVLDYFQKFSLRNPLKQARLKSMIRFLGYLERGLHRDPKSQKRLHHFVRVFQKK
uniref:Homing endonuclease LAGLIDADG domain-containing protein n=1 Tax=Chlorella vulgaris TaxID=3077 RepID=A0A650ANW2_CHLVU|nr:hypothetical protein [Chlorella vulgaris]